MKVITSFQFRAARSATRLTLRQVAEASGVSKPTIYRIEALDNFDVPDSLLSTIQKLATFYEGFGVEFTENTEDTTGIILHKKNSEE